jgi:hypothetical protein
MIRVDSRAEAIAWASRCPASDNEVIEVRQVQEFEDFPADLQAVAARSRRCKPARVDRHRPAHALRTVAARTVRRAAATIGRMRVPPRTGLVAVLLLLAAMGVHADPTAVRQQFTVAYLIARAAPRP